MSSKSQFLKLNQNYIKFSNTKYIHEKIHNKFTYTNMLKYEKIIEKFVQNNTHKATIVNKIRNKEGINFGGNMNKIFGWFWNKILNKI